MQCLQLTGTAPAYSFLDLRTLYMRLLHHLRILIVSMLLQAHSFVGTTNNMKVPKNNSG